MPVRRSDSSAPPQNDIASLLLLESCEILYMFVLSGKSRGELWIIFGIQLGRDRCVDLLAPVEH